MWKNSTIVFLIILLNLPAQSYSSEKQTLLVQLKGEKLLNGCSIKEEVFSVLGLFEVECSSKNKINILKSQLSYIKNVVMKVRNKPNDYYINDLWSFLPSEKKSDISAIQAWRLGTGGKNRDGEDVVVAVVDGGVDIYHEDLRDNIWVNQGEIANNGIDDDGNGYIDDVHGWNAYNNSGKIDRNEHGTHVAGIIGAKGNNQIGVAGVNWNVKIMALSGSSGQTSTVLKAYNYILKEKKRYLETGGKEGANIVVTNSSFGVDYADCTGRDFKLWNQVYDELGKVGIINAAATINSHVNVDEAGDVPTGCSSDSIISVTNTNIDNEKLRGAGFGKESIDIGAPGTNIFSTVLDNGYTYLTGTSMATPHVAGSVALLHSIASKDFLDFYKKSPRKGIEKLKKILLNSSDFNESLKGITVSEGRLNIYRSSQVIMNWKK